MGALGNCVIGADQIEFSAFNGIVEDVQNWTTHQTWSEGGGGYVHPQYGGYVQAPTIRSRSTHHIRVRVAWEGGRRSTIDLPGHVQLSHGDRVAFLAGENKARKLWQWVGVTNVTTESWYLVGEGKDIGQIQVQGVLERLGVLFFSIARMGGQAGALGLMIVGALLSLAIAVPLSYITGSHHFSDPFWMAAAVVAVSTFVGSRKVLGKAKAAEEEYKAQRNNMLRTALEEALRLPAPVVEATPA